MAVAGCGYWGKNLVRNFSELGVLAGICDPESVERRRSLRRSTNRRCWTGRRCSPIPRIHGVVIAAPAVLHNQLAALRWTQASMFSSRSRWRFTSADAEKLCDLAQRKNLRLMVGHLLQYHPAFPGAERDGRTRRSRPACSTFIPTGSISEKSAVRRTFSGASRRTTSA